MTFWAFIEVLSRQAFHCLPAKFEKDYEAYETQLLQRPGGHEDSVSTEISTIFCLNVSAQASGATAIDQLC